MDGVRDCELNEYTIHTLANTTNQKIGMNGYWFKDAVMVRKG